MGRRSRGAWLGSAVAVAVLSGCDTGRSATPSPNTTHPAATLKPVTASPSSIVTPPAGLAVVAAVAAVTPSGTVAFVIVTNDSTPRAPVTVNVNAASSNGKPPVTGSSTISALAPGETQATMVRLAIPSNDNVGAVTATASGPTAAATANPLNVSGAAFVSDAIQPTVDVTVSATQTVPAEVLAICYQGTMLIGGGVLTSTTVRTGTPAMLRLAAALSHTPTSCIGYAYRS